MGVSILGCGWYGQALAKALIQRGVEVKGSATTKEKKQQLHIHGITPYLVNISAEGAHYEAGFFDSDVVVVSIPPKFRKGETADFIKKIQHIIDNLIQHHIHKVIYISSTGVYGDKNGIVTERTPPRPDSENGRLLLQAEQLFYHSKLQTTVVRFGGLVGPGRHPGRFFAGKVAVPNGQAPVNLIHLNDAVHITLAILDEALFGFTINACSPHHPAKADFYTYAAAKNGFILPEFIDEITTYKIIDSVQVAPILNYSYQIDNWYECQFD